MDKSENPFADILANRISQPKCKLTFDEQCAYYAALRNNVPAKVVAQASGMKIAAVYRLASAGKPPYHYEKVWMEWQALNGERFIHKYVTPVIHDKLRVAFDQLEHARAVSASDWGFKSRADKFAGLNLIKDRRVQGDSGIEIQIAFDRDPLSPGWKWRVKDDSDWRGDPREGERGFFTSTDAYLFCKLRFAPTEEQLARGDYDRANNDDALFDKKHQQNSK